MQVHGESIAVQLFHLLAEVEITASGRPIDRPGVRAGRTNSHVHVPDHQEKSVV